MHFKDFAAIGVRTPHGLPDQFLAKLKAALAMRANDTDRHGPSSSDVNAATRHRKKL
jgi:hypothetical protein